MTNAGCKRLYAAVVLCLGITSVDAAEFLLRPSIAAEGSYNDNVFLKSDSKLSSWRAVVYPGLNLTYKRGALSTSANAYAAINRYIDNSTLNTDDQFYRLNTRYDAGRQNFGLNFSFARIATLRTEEADTGQLEFARQRERIIVQPTWQYLLTEASRLTLGYAYSQQSYTDPTVAAATQTQLVGTTTHAGNAIFDYSFTNRLRLGSEFGYSHSEGDTGYVSDGFSLRLPLSYDYSETFRTSAHVGTRYILASNKGSPTTGDAGFLFGFDFLKKFDIGNIDISLGRNVIPSGYGTQRQRDQVSVRLGANLTETLTANIQGRYYNNKQLGGEANQSANNVKNREFFSVGSNLRWELAESWVLTTGYTFRGQKLDTQPGTGYGNLVYLSVGYSFEDVFLPD